MKPIFLSPARARGGLGAAEAAETSESAETSETAEAAETSEASEAAEAASAVPVEGGLFILLAARLKSAATCLLLSVA